LKAKALSNYSLKLIQKKKNSKINSRKKLFTKKNLIYSKEKLKRIDKNLNQKKKKILTKYNYF
jgi:hypothetical protein